MEVSRNALSVDSDGEVLSAWSSRFSVSTLLDTSRTVAMVLSTSMRVKWIEADLEREHRAVPTHSLQHEAVTERP